MKMIIHRGAAEIGGNCIEIQSWQARILVDIGLPLDFDEKTEEEQKQIRVDARKWISTADAIFISHAHADHFGLLSELDRDVPVFMSRETKLLIECNPYNKLELRKMNVVIFPIRHKFGFKDIDITAYNVDHCAYGACAFLFEVEVKKILYSGDIRTHGRKGSLYKLLPQNPDYLLIEGTNIENQEKCCAESALEKRFEMEFAKSPDSLHTIWCSSQNIDRIVTIFKACIHSGKQLVVDPYTAVVLNEISKLNPHIPNPEGFDAIKIYFPKRLTDSLIKSDEARYLDNLNPRKNIITHEDIAAAPWRYVMIVRESVLDFLKVTRKEVPSIKFTISNWHEYWNEQKRSVFREWIEKNCEVTEDIHTSGHADVEGLKTIIGHIVPKAIIPIHTSSPVVFRTTLKTSAKMIIGQDGKEVFATQQLVKEFVKKVREGSKSRFGVILKPVLRGIVAEMRVLMRNGYELTMDAVKMVDAIMDAGYVIGPGRNTMAGSMVNYCLGLTDVNPQTYSLSFNRFYSTLHYEFDTNAPMEVIESIAKEQNIEIGKSLSFFYFELLSKLSGTELQSIPLDDEQAFDVFRKGETSEIVGFENEQMREYLRRIHPDNIEELSAINSMFRPGMMSLIEDYIQAKENGYVDSGNTKLDDILRPTYGLIIYQEQLLDILLNVLNLTYPESEDIRLRLYRGEEVKENNDNPIWEKVKKSGNNVFLKSHSICYSLVAYHQAYTFRK